MSILVLPLEGMLVPIALPDDGYRRHILAEVLLATALQRRLGRPVRRPHQYARKVLANCLADVAAGGDSAGARAAAIKTHIITTSELSRAAQGLPINVIGDLLCHGQVRRAPGEAFNFDYRDLIFADHLALVGRALSGLLGLDHEPDAECTCWPCGWVANGDWAAVLDQQQVNQVVIRELYEQAVLIGYPSLARPEPRTVPWQTRNEVEVSAVAPLAWADDSFDF